MRGHTLTEPDASLRRIERDSAIVCVLMAVGALILQRGGVGGALGVAGGGALMATSYRAIRAGVDAMVRGTVPAPGCPSPSGLARGRWPVLRLILRYGVVGLAAWGLLVPLQAHPVGIVAGVTAPVVAMAIEAFRLQRLR